MAGLDRKVSFVRLDTEASPNAEGVFSTTRELSGNAVDLYIAVRLPLLERVILHEVQGTFGKLRQNAGKAQVRLR